MKIQKSEGCILLLGGLGSESITTAIKSNVYDYLRKDFQSSPTNWHLMAQMLEDTTANEIPCVLVKLTEYTLIRSLGQEYDVAFDRICAALSSHRHIIFIYADNLSGIFSFREPDSYFIDSVDSLLHGEPEFVQPEKQKLIDEHKAVQATRRLQGAGYMDSGDRCEHELKQRIQKLHGLNLNLAPYRTLVNLNVAAQEFLEEAFRGLLMRIYIPNDRIWATELDKLLSLFQDYLRKTQNYPVTLDQQRTEKGLIYGFYCADDSVKPEQLSGLLEQFSSFMELAANNPSQAAELLRNTNLPEAQRHSIVSKYSKESRRLSLDIEHERESKLLAIRHRFESELLDTITDHEQQNYLALIDNNVKKNNNPLDVIKLVSLPSSGNTFVQSQIINMHSPQFVNQARGIIAQEINGTINYTEQDERLLELFAQHSPVVDQVDLKSSLDELKDESVPQAQRTTAWQKIQGFLSKHSETIEKTALTVLEKYIEHLLAKS